MKLFNTVAGNLVATLIKVLLKASPQFREAIKKAIAALERKAKETPNPYDNAAVELIKAILGLQENPEVPIDLPDVVLDAQNRPVKR